MAAPYYINPPQAFEYPPYVIAPITTNKFDTYNQHGHRLCDGYGCRKHVRLHWMFGGFFCIKHVRLIASIREKKGRTSDVKEELEWRLEEMRARKTMDPGHMHYIGVLEKMV